MAGLSDILNGKCNIDLSYVCMENPGENKTLILLFIWKLCIRKKVCQEREVINYLVQFSAHQQLSFTV